MAAPFATRQDIAGRHPTEIAVLAADEATRLPDWARVDAALIDASAEIRFILQGKYTPAQLDDLDAGSLAGLKIYCVQMAMYFVSVSFGRQTEAIKERYDTAIARLKDIVKSAGGLTFATPPPSAGGEDTGGAGSPGGVQIAAPERVFTRQTGGW